MDAIGVFTKIFRIEQSIDKMIKSVLNQTFDNYIFYILVNENTKSYVSNIVEDEGRVVIFDATNINDDFQNYYLFIAKKHKYVMTIDADDWLDLKCLEKMYFFSEKNDLDIIACGNYFFSENTNQIAGIRCLKNNIVCSTIECMNNLSVTYQFFRTLWGKLWRSDLLKKISVLPTSFHLGGYGGDTMGCFCLLNESKKIGIMNTSLYYYRINEKSVSYSIKSGRMKSDAELFKYVYDIIERNNCLNNDNLNFLINVYQYAIYDSIDLVNNSEVENKWIYFEELLCSELICRLFLSNKYKDFKTKVFVKIFQGLKIQTLKNYYKLFMYIFPEYVDLFPLEIYYEIFMDDNLLNAVISVNIESISKIFFDKYIQSTANDDKIKYYSVYRKITNNKLLKNMSDSFITSYDLIGIIRSIYENNIDLSLDLCRKKIKTCENNIIFGELLEIIVYLSALKKDSVLFLQYRLLLLEYYRINNLQDKYNELYKKMKKFIRK